jgi:hypothetical protein
MVVRTLIVASIIPAALAGCAAHPYRERLAACEARTFRTQVQRVTCLNDAETGGSFAATRAQRHRLRLGLAAKVDAGEITQAQADEQFSRYLQQLQENESRHRNAMAGVRGALIGAGVR